MTAQAASVQVERVLDDLIQRLTDREKTPEVRAALIEARRLKNVTTRWAAIPPPPDARREMLTRVMELVSAVGSPITFSSPPPASGPAGSGPSTPRPQSSPSPASRRGAMAHAPTEAALGAVDGGTSSNERRTATPPPQPVRDPRKRTTGSFGFGAIGKAEASRPSPPLGSDDFDAPPTRPATLSGFQSSSDAKPPSSRKSAFPTAPPPSPSAALGVAGKPVSSGRHAATAPPPSPVRTSGGFGEGRGRTLAQGSVEVTQALAGLGAPALPRIDDPPTEQEPSVARRAETREMPLESSPPRQTISSTPTPAPVRAPTAQSDGRLEGFSKTVSMVGIPAVRAASPKVPTIGPSASRPVRPASNPTQTLFGAGIQQALKDSQKDAHTPAPPSARRPGSMPPGMRTIVAPGVTIVRPSVVDWQPLPGAAGVTIKTLYRDPRAGIYTALLRFAPGAVLARRRHASAEELYVVSGTAMLADHELSAGEYARAESETVTEAIRSPNGCTLFVCGSENDEILDDV